MAWGILEPTTTSGLEHVPGTAQLEDNTLESTAHLKKGIGKDNEIVLIPQPSSDPNDPLNWPLWQRDLILLLYCYCTNICVGGIGPLLSIIAVPLMVQFHVGFTEVTLLSGYQLATVGAVGFIVSALACKFGKRSSFLASLALLLAGTIWCGEATSYNSMLGGRILQGLGTATFESITFAIIGDLYFVHQRGSRMAIYVISQTGLVLLPSLIAGKVAEDLGWRWSFRLLSIFLAVGFLGVIIFGWETTFTRNAIYNLDTSSHNNIRIIENLKAGNVSQTEDVNNPLEKPMTTTSATDVRPRDSFLKRMKPWSTIYTQESLFKIIVRPFYVLANPVIIWALLIIGFSQLWGVVISYTLAQIFSPPPYSLNPAQLGYISAGPMVAGILGCFFCGAVSDPLCRYMSKRNNGVYEPEYRLIIMVFVPLFAGIGYFLFGKMAEEGKSPIALSVIWGVIFVSVQVVGNAAGAYLVDAFRNVSIEIFIISMTVKNFLFFGFSFFLNDWVSKWGPAKVFDCIGGVMLALSTTTIPVYVYGKKMRAWWHTHDVLAKI